MAAASDPCVPHSLTADDVARGVARMFARMDQVVLREAPLPNGRRADLVTLDPRGRITIVEIKVSRADLHGDAKWPDYCDWCDAFYWALASGLDPAILDTDPYTPDQSGLIIADRYDAAIVREATGCGDLAPARRKAETLRLARLAMRRQMMAADPDLMSGWPMG